jgi:tRNA1(Val) A37 N6-methylase TrmN6
MEYSSISTELTNKLSTNVKKSNGIYFTPPSTVDYNIQLLKPYIIKSTKEVLEPSCGSGEFITNLNNTFPKLKITGIENNSHIYNTILQLENDNISIHNKDFITYDNTKTYDMIIGNPPYYVMKKEEVDNKYRSYFDGRPNIFIIFILRSLELLNDNGILSFVLPKNFLNCLYYDKTRKYISSNFQILQIAECNDEKYIETNQETFIFIIRKQKQVNNKLFILDINNYTIFANEDNIKKLTNLYKNSSTLVDHGFTARIGTVVWNQCKDILTNDTSKTRLIYSSDIVDHKLSMKTYKNKDKKNFINKPGNTKTIIVVNRGYGTGNYKFNYSLIDCNCEYLIENHLICIEHTGDLSNKSVTHTYKKILSSFNDKRTTEFINIYFGNNAINTAELNYILPIY